MTDLPLVLLHAFPVDSRMWDGVREPLAARTRVITPDQRGLGRSPLPSTLREPTLIDAARDVISLLDKLELPQVVLGGCSMGGYVAMAVLRLAPERMAGVVLIDTKASADADEARANRLTMADRVSAEGVSFLPDAMLPAVLGPTTRSSRPAVVARARELILSQPPAGVAWAQRAMADRGDSADVLRTLDVPALVVVGQEDELTGLSDAQALVDVLPHATLDVIPDAGHLSPLEDPAAVAEAILSWLR